MSPNLKIVQSDTARRHQFERTAAGCPIAIDARTLVSWRGVFVSAVICAVLLGLMVVFK